ncbi:mitochondrial uncoupling protein 4-like [Ruditapes philippinarum]|uniref:mitochondrial uncoupling protein 4-like n=1 Tax=Ruditapes philippinarum TaxID=129788 RepID=UPI00295BDB2D|nr:mitochondrial uncoupling protein 4-like [Ruditapes philippinarum]XP_060586090.1 mitochondrial uncoupling protein 4-like [Ruditapes philippinarum]XP_060586091.1 mitochondrial uncoupling protein 4-like [Ruditapes philippinarum]XP_060586092.1 mitochondrial uncoupling protein 4-like [Ruditapes philippinarum]XP_060586093.1 mitochondrial uncoupling protein 4-like [Ruditapes philippinarum]
MADDDVQVTPSPGEELAYKFVLSAVSAMVAESVTYPLDLTRTRLQIQGEVNVTGTTVSHSKRGMFKIMQGIVTEEGLLKLWQGISPALYRQIIYSGFRMVIYEGLRDHVFQKNDDGSFPLWKSVIVSGTCGALGQLAASPTDLVKVQMQMEGRLRLEGKPVRVTNCAQAFRTIYRESGIRGLWRGWVPNVQRSVLVNVGDLVTYDTVKRQILIKTSLPDNYIVHGISSACSGLVASIMCTPADVVKTRVMNQPIKDGRPVLYKNSIDCLVKTVKQEGFMALYKGFVPTYCRLGPWLAVFWLSYEQFRRVTGHVSF